MRWTQHEDTQLKAAVAQLNARNWKAIAELVPGRSHTQCCQRWNKALKPGLRHGPWSPQEDALLLAAIDEARTQLQTKWTFIATKVEGRISKQCQERWAHHLDPSINWSPYSAAEDEQILRMHSSMGRKWNQMAKMLGTRRTGESVKSRFNSLDRHRENGAAGPCPQACRSQGHKAYERAVAILKSRVVETELSRFRVGDGAIAVLPRLSSFPQEANVSMHHHALGPLTESQKRSRGYSSVEEDFNDFDLVKALDGVVDALSGMPCKRPKIVHCDINDVSLDLGEDLDLGADFWAAHNESQDSRDSDSVFTEQDLDLILAEALRFCDL